MLNSVGFLYHKRSNIVDCSYVILVQWMAWRLWILGVFGVKKFSKISEKLCRFFFHESEMNLRDRDTGLHKVHCVCDLVLSTRVLYNIYVVSKVAVVWQKILCRTWRLRSKRKDFKIFAPERKWGGMDEDSVQIYLKHIVQAFKAFLARVWTVTTYFD